MKGTILLIALFIPTLVYADVVIKTKAGSTLEWKSYTEKDGQYCTVKYGGDFCGSSPISYSEK